MDSTEEKGDTPKISKKEMELITRGDELDDNIITQAMRLIMKIKPELKIQPTSLSQCPQLLQHHEGETLFIHHKGNHHFITSTSIGGVLRTYDSLNLKITKDTFEQIAGIYTPNKNLKHPAIKKHENNEYKT